MILASISGGQSLGKPPPTYRDRVQASAKGRSRSLAASPSRSSLRMLSASTRSLEFCGKPALLLKFLGRYTDARAPRSARPNYTGAVRALLQSSSILEPFDFSFR